MWHQWLKSVNFGGPISGETPIWYPQTVFKFHLSYLLTLNISCFQLKRLKTLKSVNFGGSISGETPIWYPQTVFKFHLSYLLTLNISCFQLKRLKTLNFGRSHLGEIPIFERPVFVRFSLFLIFTHSKNSIHLMV